jgi:hypothetical protein
MMGSFERESRRRSHFDKSRICVQKNIVRKSAAAGFAALTAILPNVIGERTKGRVIGRVVVKGALASGGQHAGIDQALQMVAECRGRKVDMRLDLPSRRAIAAGLHHEPQDLKADRMAKRAELLGVAFKFRGHALLLIFSKLMRKG